VLSDLCHHFMFVCKFMWSPFLIWCLRACCLLLCAVSAADSVHGQDDAGAPALPVNESGEASKDVSTILQQELFQKDDGAKEPPVESWSISEIHAEGEVADRHVEMQLTVLVTVLEGDDWVKIPIELPAWQIRDFNVTHNGEPGNSILATNSSRQRVWSLRGKGDHLLTLQLIGEVVTAESGRRRIRMSLPEALISSLKLSFQEPVEKNNIESNAEVPAVVIEDTENHAFQFWGLRPETDINWKPAVPAGESATVVRASRPAEMVLDLRTSVAELRCTQELTVDSGAVDRLEVRLPPGYGEVAVTARDENGQLVTRAGDVSPIEDSDLNEIRFREPVTGTVTLEYILAMATTIYPQEIAVAVPDIQSVDDESGRVEILIPRGLNVKASPGLLTRRDSVETPPDRGHDVIAFALMSTKAELGLSVSEIDAHFVVDPEIEISTSGTSLLMLAQFSVNVSQGSLKELDVVWPEFEQTGWQLRPGMSSLQTEADDSYKDLAPERDGDKITLDLVKNQSGRFLVEFRAFRSLTDADAGQHSFHLPDVRASTSHPTTITLVESDNYSLALSVADGEARISPQLPDKVSDPQQLARRTSWLVNDSGTRVQIQQTFQTEEVSATAVVALEPSGRDSIHVHSEVRINVQHGDLDELRMVVPDSVTPKVRLRQNGTYEPLPSGRISGNDMVWALPESMPRQLLVEVDYWWPLDAEADLQRLPLVLPSQGLESLTIGTSSPEMLQVADEPGLQEVFPDTFQAAWHGSEFRKDVLLNVASMRRFQKSREVPAVAFVRTDINRSAIVSTTTAVYSARPRDVLFRVAVGSNVTAIAVNGMSVPVADVDRVVVDSAELWHVPMGDVAQNGAVHVSLTVSVLRAPHHHLISTATAVYPRVQSAPDWLSTIWIVGGSEDDCLIAMKRTAEPVLRPSVFRFLTASLHQSTLDSEAIDSIITGFPQPIQELLQEELRTPEDGSTPSLMYVAGPQLREVDVLVVSRAVGWLISAALGIGLYVLLVRYEPRLRSVVLIGVIACCAIFLALPPQYLELSFALIPAVLIACIGWGMRQIMQRGAANRRTVSRHGSVFATVRHDDFHSRSGSRNSAGSGLSQPEIATGS